MDSIQPAMTAADPFCALVGRCRSFVETGSWFSQTALILEVVAPLSVPMKMCLLELMVSAGFVPPGDCVELRVKMEAGNAITSRVANSRRAQPVWRRGC